MNNYSLWIKNSIEVSRPKTFLYMAMWSSAVIVGVMAVLYSRLISHLQNTYFKYFGDHPIIVSVFTPLLFVVATAIVKYLAPEAKGSGIPQVLVAIEAAHNPAIEFS